MKIEVINGEIVCTSSSWKKLKDEERRFLSHCAYENIWGTFNKSGHLELYKSYTTQDKIRRVKFIISESAKCNVECTDELSEILETLKNQAETERILKEKKELENFFKARWESRKKGGCDGCKYFLRMGEMFCKCNYSGEMLETKISPKYNFKTQCLELFHETGIPNDNCKDSYEKNLERIKEG